MILVDWFLFFISCIFFIYYKRFRFNNQSEKSFKYFLKIIPSLIILWFSVELLYADYIHNNETETGETYNERYSLVLTVFILGVVIFAERLSANIFLPKINNKQEKEYIEVKNISNYDVHTYPRVTIFKNSEVIFDSSDFEVVNKTLNTFQSGSSFDFQGTSYRINNIRVIFLSLFDDYTWDGTKTYSGKPIPFNVKINVFVEEELNFEQAFAKMLGD